MSSEKPLHILLVSNYTIRCGITNALAKLANHMAERGHKVTIYNQKPVPAFLYPLYKIGRTLHTYSLPDGVLPDVPRGTRKLEDMYKLHPNVDVKKYTLTDKNLKIQRLRAKLRELSPDVCVCMFPDAKHLIWAVTLLGSGIPYIYSEHHSPATIENVFWNRKGRLAAMSGADAIHLLLPSFKESVPDFMREKVSIIPNSVSKPEKLADPKGKERKTLLWVGRLHEELKQCRLAVDAFGLFADKFPDWEMHMFGDGQDKELVKNHILTKGLQNRVKLMGETSDMQAAYTSGQALCFSSRTEGLPFVLLEAMSYGLPCAGFSDCDGVVDLIRHEQNGLLAEQMTAESLSKQLERLMSDENLRCRLGQGAAETTLAYSEKNIFDSWEELLQKTAAKKGNTIMDSFREEPFASQARLSACARREWLWRDFGDPMPETLEYKLAGIMWRIKRPFKKLLSTKKSH